MVEAVRWVKPSALRRPARAQVRGRGYARAVERDFAQELKVGLFVLFFICVIGLAVFILGGSTEMFEHTYTLRTAWHDVKGMKVGAVVRVAGIDVGEVSRVEFLTPEHGVTPEVVTAGVLPAGETAENARKLSIYVELKVREQFQDRIRDDSLASITQVGLLGDQYVTITVGGVEATPLANNTFVKSAEALNPLDYVDSATAIVENAKSISGKVDLMLGSDEAAANAGISQSFTHIEQILADAKDGKGVLHLLIYDKAAAASLRRSLQNIEGLTANLNDITREVKSGNGMASALIYGEDGDKLVAELTAVAGALEGMLADIKNEQSLVHALVYEPERAQMVADLAETAKSLRAVAQEVETGDGTAGLMVRDPQLYEDLRALVGGAQRNALLRAYIRSTVARSRGEQAGAPPSDDPKSGGR